MHTEAGQSLIEVIVASTVSVLMVTALVFATIFSLRNASLARNTTQAAKLAQEGLEKVRILRDRDGTVNNFSGVSKFSDLYNSSISLNCPSSCYFYFNGDTLYSGNSVEVIPSSIFTRQIKIEDNAQEQKRVTAIVSWTDFAGLHNSMPATILRKL